MASDQIYHIKRTITDFNPSLTNQGYTVDILGTYTDLALAKKAARSALFSEGYKASDFEIYEENNGDENWVHGDGVKVYAKAYAGQVLEVMIDTKPNTEGWWSSNGEFDGCGEGLYYVFETITNYYNDRIVGAQSTEVDGAYLSELAAKEHVKTALLNGGVRKESFAEYDEKGSARDADEWPFGDDVYVHAVAETGENFLVSVKKGKKHANLIST